MNRSATTALWANLVVAIVVLAPRLSWADSNSFALINMTGPIAGFNGSGVLIGQVDETVPDGTQDFLMGRIAFTTNLARGDIGLSGPHGTEVAGVMVSTDTVVRGVAPGATIAAIEVNGATQAIDAAFFLVTNQQVRIINQSYGIGASQPVGGQSNIGTSLWERALDNLVAVGGVVFVQAAGNDGPPAASINEPASAYNIITVGSVTNVPFNVLTNLPPGQMISPSSSRGPLLDGRSKPDIVAPGAGVIMPTSPGGFIDNGGDRVATNTGTSFAAPQVSGVVALLMQATSNLVAGGTFTSGTTGSGTTAKDPRTVKALLLNSATKLPGWTQPGTTTNDGVVTVNHPLDPSQGSGLLNAAGAYAQLAAGQFIPTFRADTNTVQGGINILTNAAVPLAGWDLHTVVSGGPGNFYLLGQPVAGSATVTLDWYRQVNDASSSYSVVGLNNLDLILWKYANGTNGPASVFAQSISTNDNVEQLYFTDLPSAYYGFQVVYSTDAPPVTLSDQYAVAWDFATVPEPSALLLSLLGIGGLCLLKRKPSS